MKKRVMVDLLNLANPQIAGVGVFAKNLFHFWFAAKMEYDVVCYVPSFIDPNKVFGINASNGVTIKTVNVKHVFVRLLYQQLVLPFHLKDFSLYFNPAVGIPFLSKITTPKTKLVVTIHDMTPFHYPKKYSRIRSILVRFLSKNAAKVADKIITVSKNSASDIVKFGKVSTDKVQIIYNFILPPYEFNNHIKGKYFLCISTIEPGKNPEKVIEGFAKFKQQTGLDYKFYWIGRFGWVIKESYLRQYIRTHNVEDDFILVGYVSEQEKRDFIRNCAGIVYLSFYEGFGLPPLEGMTFNKPSVVSNVSSLPEVVGEAGVLCDPHDANSIAKAMLKIVTNREDFVSKIPIQMKKFDPQIQTSIFIKLIENLVIG